MFTITIRPVHNVCAKPIVLHANTWLGKYLQLLRVTYTAAKVYDSVYGKIRYEDSPVNPDAVLVIGGAQALLEISVHHTPESPDEEIELSNV